MSANNTAWSLKKLPTISVPTPLQGQRRVSPARAAFYHMGLVGGRLGRLSARELKGRERPHQLGMGGADMGVDLGQQHRLVLRLQDLPAPALDDGCHPTVKTTQLLSLFPFAASAYASWRLEVTCLK